MSPIQFQKRVRLGKARGLLFDQQLSCGEASRLVGYRSASRFSRDYRRYIGRTPNQDCRH